MGRLLDVIAAVYRQLGLDQTCGKDAVFEQLVTARIIEPTSKQDAARVLAEAGVRARSYRTVKRRLPRYARPDWRDRLSGACAAAAQIGPSALVLYDVSGPLALLEWSRETLIAAGAFGPYIFKLSVKQTTQ
jgi:hypothetical protein